MKFESDIRDLATSDLVATQHAALQFLVCDGFDTAARVYLCAVDKELKKRINCSALVPLVTTSSLQSTMQCWEMVSNDDDKRVVGKIAEEINSYLSQNQHPLDFETIAKYIAAQFDHGIYCDDVEVALAKLISKGEVVRNENRYHIAKPETLA